MVYIYIYIEISSKILPYRLHDVIFHNILLCGSVFVSVLMLVCTLCMYIGNSIKYYNNKYIRQKMVNHELTFLERLRRRFIVKFFSFSRIEMVIIFLWRKIFYLFALYFTLFFFFLYMYINFYCTFFIERIFVEQNLSIIINAMRVQRRVEKL